MSITGKDILIVDDDHDLREIVVKILSAAGVKTLDVHSLEAARKLMASKLPHLILLDLEMPGESGFDFLETRQKDPVLRQIPVIVLSAHGTTEVVCDAIAKGANDYLLKPVAAALLLRKIRKVLHDKGHLTYVADESENLALTVSVSGNIVEASEVGITLEAPVKISPNSKVVVRSPMLDKLGLATETLHATRDAALPSFDNPGRYVKRLLAVGMDEITQRKLKKLLGELP